MKKSFRVPPCTVPAAALMLGASQAVMVGLGVALGLLGPAPDANGQLVEQRLKSFGIAGQAGANPVSLLQGSDGALYGATYGVSSGGYGYGGPVGPAVVFRLNTNGSGFAVLHTFGDYENLNAIVQGRDGALYGTTQNGGSNYVGSVFKLNTDGTGYTVLYRFTGTGGDGAYPNAPLVQGSDGALYGTTAGGGGTNGFGTVFKLSTDGTGYSVLYSFTGSGGDGINPSSALVQDSNGALYGTTWSGGDNGAGTVFKLTTNGTSYAILYGFAGNSGGDGYYPDAGLARGGDGALYGTTSSGGTYSRGTVFKLSADGSGYTLLYSFTGTSGDGANAYGPLVQGSDGALYGTTQRGGTNGNGTVFKLNTNGTGYTVLYRFIGSGGDGAGPNGVVQGSDGRLYGTTWSGGDNGAGTVFRLSTDGTGYTVLRSFSGSVGDDGAGPYGPLLQGSDGWFYGTTSSGGGPNNSGTVFKLSTNGMEYAVLHSFTGNGGDGADPYGGLIQGPDGALHGTTSTGAYNYGIVFKLSTDGTGYTVLRRFTGTGGDGAAPIAGLVQGSDGALHGTTQYGGDLGLGTVFRLGAVAPPRFTQFARSQDGNIQLALSGAPYVVWRVEVATNLSPPSCLDAFDQHHAHQWHGPVQ